MFQLFLKLQESDQPWKNKFVIYFYMARKSHLFVFVCHKQWSSYYEKCIIFHWLFWRKNKLRFSASISVILVLKILTQIQKTVLLSNTIFCFVKVQWHRRQNPRSRMRRKKVYYSAFPLWGFEKYTTAFPLKENDANLKRRSILCAQHCIPEFRSWVIWLESELWPGSGFIFFYF